MNLIVNRINQVRHLMSKHNISAFLVTGTDPFLSEYLPEHWNQRFFISGFSGSAGKVVITKDTAGLWTDSRYFIQADEELNDSGIAVFKMGQVETPSITLWLKQNLAKGDTLGVNPLLLSVNDFEKLKSDLAESNVNLIPSIDYVEEIWTNQPSLPLNNTWILKDEITGEAATSKLNRLREYLLEQQVDACFIASLDEIAWLFNIRGSDIKYNPVCIAYAMVTKTSAYLYIHPNKIDQELVQEKSFTSIDFDEMKHHLQSCTEVNNITIDPARLNYSTFKTLKNNFNIQLNPSWITLNKSTKNTIEVQGTREAMIKDGIALVRFFMWLETTMRDGNPISEYDVGTKLKHFRNQQKAFKDESFSTIAGYNENGAIVHYSAPKTTSKTLSSGILLVDSGGQYEHGTTDITRTIALGKVSDKAKKDYTLVLKGHLALSNIVFPKGTRGDQLDVLARQFLWENSLDYGHGTGHGVGHFLNVHEGPQSISKNYNATPLLPGMICSNEPGLYRAGEYGIRIENLVFVKSKENNDFGDFLEFETLTLFPYDTALIDKQLLSKTEKEQVNIYHQKVKKALSEFLLKEEQIWLHKKTLAI